MKAYLSTTGILFGAMALVHVWRAIVEWPKPPVQPGYLAGMAVLILLPAALAAWAWQLLRRSKSNSGKESSSEGQT
jgi:tetrahydromethanopterin S-methyltransferase subunit E